MRRTNGGVKAVILDWSGTTIDYGSIAPAKVFVEVFRRRGVSVTTQEARIPMGKYKRDHLREMTQMPRIAQEWQRVHKRLPTEADIDSLFEAYTPIQLEVTTHYADLIPGVLETIEGFRSRGLKVGSCTGYTRVMMEPLLPLVKAQGYEPDALVCPDDVGGGRPLPWMCFENLRRLEVFPPYAAVKIGDTLADVHEGLNAGMWTVGLALTGNEIGLSESEWKTLPEITQMHLRKNAYKHLHNNGAHYVVDNLAQIPEILEQIESNLRRGQRP